MTESRSRGAARLESALRDPAGGARAGFVPYICAGYPAPEATAQMLWALERAGAAVVEVGVPFSDPIADGPTIQRASEISLAHGTTLDGVLSTIARLRSEGLDVPILLFSYANPLLQLGWEGFAERAADSGVDGALLVDLPVEEARGPAGGDYLAAMHSRGLGTVFLASPTTQRSRLERVGAASAGFVYYVSRLGVTGAAAGAAADDAGARIEALKADLDLPVAVGFGISKPEEAVALAGSADGIVVGSALIRAMDPDDVEGSVLGLEVTARAFVDALAGESL